MKDIISRSVKITRKIMLLLPHFYLAQGFVSLSRNLSIDAVDLQSGFNEKSDNYTSKTVSNCISITKTLLVVFKPKRKCVFYSFVLLKPSASARVIPKQA